MDVFFNLLLNAGISNFVFVCIEQATKYCGEDGQWFRLPQRNKTWTNYTLCAINFKEKVMYCLWDDY